MKKLKGLTVLFMTIGFSLQSYAQDEKAGQVTFIYPVGTAGTNSVNYSNKFSLNIIDGVNGGVNGFELGSVANINKGYVHGVQISGVCNYTTGNSDGVIISGAANISQGNLGSTGLSGVANYSGGNSNGVAISGAANIIMEKSNGAMIAGAVNYSGSHKGLQLSPFNIAVKKANGSQIGVVNIAGNAKGVQFGVFNICNNPDSIIPFGIFNVVKNGYYAFELSTNELFLSSLSFKMGIEKFYTIFRAGIGAFNSENNFSTGMGFGSIISIKNKHKLNLELICDNLHYDKKWNGDNINLLNQFNLNYQYQINDRLAVKGGPGIKVYVTDQKVNGKFNTIDVPYTIFEDAGRKVKTSGWVGFNAGIVVSL
jgi:hypothetical protein